MRLMTAAGVGVTVSACGDESRTTDVELAVATDQPADMRRQPTAPSQQATKQPLPATDGPVQPTEEPEQTADSRPPAEVSGAYLSVARGSDPRAITRAALAAIGGMERFVKSGDDVIIKPNICVDYHTYEYAATTNPEVVAALVELCLGSGAKRVRVMDSPFGGGPESAYARSGIAAAVKAAGGDMEVMVGPKFRETQIPEGLDISRWHVYQDVLTTDVLIDVPVAKHHSRTRLTLGGKNLMGVILGRGMIHSNLSQRIADLVSLIRPTLTVVDAVRILMANGPGGGNLDDVRRTDTVIASHDIVAADSYAATLFGLQGQDIGYVKAAAGMGLGTMDLGAVKIEEVSL